MVDPSSTEPSRRELLILAAALLVLLATLSTWGHFDFRDSMGYYGMFADALLHGRLALDYTPDQVNLTDMIPFEGRYYFQWGPLPVLFHLVLRPLGLRLSDRVLCLLAGWLMALAFLAVTLHLRRRFFPALSWAACRWFLLAFALGTPAALVTIRGTVYNESIGVATLAVLGAYGAYLLYVRDFENARAGRWALLCGAAVAAALLSRVSHVFEAPAFFVAIAAAHWLSGRDFKRAAAHLALFSVPVLIGCGLHMAHNQARFGSPFDFGRIYKPETIEHPEVQPFDAACIVENVGHYFIAPPRLSADFPYIAHTGRQPADCVFRTEAVSSLILAGPFLLFGLLALPLLRAGPSRELRLAVLGAAAPAGVMLLVLMSFAAASRRYSMDFVPLLMVLAFFGLARWLGREGESWRRRRVVPWAVLIWSAAINIHVPFYQSFHTPTPDLNVMRTFVQLAPTLDKISPGPELHKQAAIAAHDLGAVLAQERRFAEAADAFEQALRWDPDSPRIRRNYETAKRLAGGK